MAQKSHATKKSKIVLLGNTQKPLTQMLYVVLFDDVDFSTLHVR